MSVGIVILEIPSNLILYKLGPRLWLGLQVFAWSVLIVVPVNLPNSVLFYVLKF